MAFPVMLLLCLAIARAAPSQEPPRASLAHPVVLRLVIPYDPRCRRASCYLVTDYHVDDADLAVKLSSGRTVSMHFGMLVPMAQRSIPRAVPTVAIPAGAAAGAPMFLSMRTETDRPSVSVQPADSVIAQDAALWRDLTYPLLLVCSMLLALAVSNAIYFASSRHASYIYYCAVMLIAAVLTLHANPDILWGWILPNASIPYRVVTDVPIIAYMVFVVLFARSFLDLKRLHPRFDRALQIALLSYIALFSILEAFFTDAGGERALSNAAGAALLGVVLFAGVAGMRRGHETATYFVVGFVGAWVFIAIYDVYSIAGITLWPIFFLGTLWQGAWLTAALANQLKRLQEDREKEQLQRIAERQYATFHDPLTGLFNRRKMRNELRSLPPWEPNQAREFALLYLDIDHFKVVNDTSGHEAGDRLVREVAQRLRGEVGAEDTLARVGGDEFAILLRDRTEIDIRILAYEIRDRISAMQFRTDSHVFPLSASIGCAILRFGGHPDALFELADAACATAKETGRNRVHFVSDELSAESARSEMIWVGEIVRAIEENRFALYYQTIVPARENGARRGRHIEIFVRMIGDDGSIIDPPHFMSSAERYNLMANVDRWVIASALPALRPLTERGEIHTIAINLSANSLHEENLAGFITDELRSSGLEPSLLCLEISETGAASALGSFTALTTTLRPMGVRFALDEFGTGTSSLALLKRLEVDYLKIDGSFVRDCATDAVDAAMVEAINRFAKVLGLKTIAVQAEDRAVLARLRSIGVDFVQGWASSSPQPLEALTKANCA